MTLECNGTACASPEVIRPLSVAARPSPTTVCRRRRTASVRSSNCRAPTCSVLRPGNCWRLGVPSGAQPAVRQTFALPLSANVIKARGIFVRVQLRCKDAGTNASSSLVLRTERIDIGGYPSAPSPGGTAVSVVQFSQCPAPGGRRAALAERRPPGRRGCTVTSTATSMHPISRTPAPTPMRPSTSNGSPEETSVGSQSLRVCSQTPIRVPWAHRIGRTGASTFPWALSPARTTELRFAFAAATTAC